MVGITLSQEQIQHAPAEVRRWLEQQVAETLGLRRGAPQMPPPGRHLVGCSLDEARVILSAIEGKLPVAAVFFELGRHPEATAPNGLRALRLDDMARHVRLQTTEQVVACLAAIDEALQRLSGQSDAALTALDGAGHCLVAEQTAHSVLALWHEIVTQRDMALHESATGHAAAPATAPPFQEPYAVSVPGLSA